MMEQGISLTDIALSSINHSLLRIDELSVTVLHTDLDDNEIGNGPSIGQVETTQNSVLS